MTKIAAREVSWVPECPVCGWAPKVFSDYKLKFASPAPCPNCQANIRLKSPVPRPILSIAGIAAVLTLIFTVGFSIPWIIGLVAFGVLVEVWLRKVETLEKMEP
jgi:uncharacterized paraquat-inducible protein A